MLPKEHEPVGWVRVSRSHRGGASGFHQANAGSYLVSGRGLNTGQIELSHM